MALNFNRNGIFMGQVDWFCLVCDLHIRGEEHARSHIAEESHERNLGGAKFEDKYMDDQIMKVKRGYLCVYCNMVFPTATKVAFHLTETVHNANKHGLLLRREGDEVVFHDLVLDGCAWQGIVGDMCAVCNVEFEDETLHKEDPTHAFNLARNKVEYGINNDIYRKIDDTTCQCITCNIVLPIKNIITHFEDLEHKNELENNVVIFIPKVNKLSKTDNMVNGHKEDFKRNDTKHCSSGSEDFNFAEDSSDETYGIATKYTKEENRMKILESVTTFEKNEVNINFENETAICKKCLGNIDFDYEAVEKHIDSHRKHPKKRDVGYVPFQCEVDMKGYFENTPQKCCQMPKLAINSAKDFSSVDENQNATKTAPKSNENKAEDDIFTSNEDLEIFAKENQLTYNKDNSNAFCRVCEIRMPANLRSMKEHVFGKPHNKRLSMPKTATSTSYSTRPNIIKMATKHYLLTVYTIRSILVRETVVNKKFCMETSSYHFITSFGGRLRCQMCEESFWPHDREDHEKSYDHRRALYDTPVITKYSSEFLREIRPGLFHCAFCNLMEVSLESLTEHLCSAEHERKKKTCAARLQRHLPDILEREMREMMMSREERFLRMIFGMPFF